MPISAENLRFILGLKLKALRQDRGFTLKEVAARADLSVSYLSEIEQGKKYPKPDKLLQLAAALGVPFDDLVSLSVSNDLDLVRDVFGSTLVQEFPFELFGLASQDVFRLITYDPGKAVALIHTLLDVGRTYDVQVEHFLFAALRSFQQMHANYFEELEDAAAAYRAAAGWRGDVPVEEATLRGVLENQYGYVVDDVTLADHPDLCGFRSVFVEDGAPRLFVNSRLQPIQRAFVYGREIGFRHLDLTERPRTSSWIKAESFDEVLNNFKASYFSGALLLDRDRLLADLTAFFKRDVWDEAAFLALFQGYQGTPEMLFYRLTELVPRFFKLHDVFFVRFHHTIGSDRFRLTKVFNLAQVPVPRDMVYSEHYCRRWPAMQLLRALATRQEQGEAAVPAVRVQRSRFIEEDAEFFVVSLARPLSLTEATNSSVSLGFLINDRFKRTVRFWNDPAVPRIDVNLTCERCALSAAACTDRAAPPSAYLARQRQARQEAALEDLFAQYAGNG